MTIFNVKFDIDGLEETEKQAFIDLLNLHPSDRKGAKYDSKAIMNELIKTYVETNAVAGKSGISAKTSDRIKDCVQAQMDLNANSTKYVEVGSDKEKVFYEKRALTPKKIADLGGFNLNSVFNWLNQDDHASWIDQHNKDVLGLESDILGWLKKPDEKIPAKDSIKTFNLKAARSNRTFAENLKKSD